MHHERLTDPDSDLSVPLPDGMRRCCPPDADLGRPVRSITQVRQVLREVSSVDQNKTINLYLKNFFV